MPFMNQFAIPLSDSGWNGIFPTLIETLKEKGEGMVILFSRTVNRSIRIYWDEGVQQSICLHSCPLKAVRFFLMLRGLESQMG